LSQQGQGGNAFPSLLLRAQLPHLAGTPRNAPFKNRITPLLALACRQGAFTASKGCPKGHPPLDPRWLLLKPCGLTSAKRHRRGPSGWYKDFSASKKTLFWWRGLW